VTAQCRAFDPSVVEQLVEELGTVGYGIAPSCLSSDICAALRGEANSLPDDPVSIDAGVGRHARHTLEHDIRKSTIKWIDGATPAQRDFLEAADMIRVEINRQLFLGLFSFEAQLAFYAPGGFYTRHIDSFSGARNRVVSLVTYLTPAWPKDGGGELVIWADRDVSRAPVASVRPEAGTIVLMLSEDIPHEVRVAHHPRASIAGWWRVRPD
jgi:SM-20-related protein